LNHTLFAVFRFVVNLVIIVVILLVIIVVFILVFVVVLRFVFFVMFVFMFVAVLVLRSVFVLSFVKLDKPEHIDRLNGNKFAVKFCFSVFWTIGRKGSN